jgi:transglutaminase-like putative cysteine protease
MEKSATRSRWWDWAAILLLFALLQIVTARLVATEWTEHLALVQISTSMGLAIGLALGYSQFQPRAARWISFCYMLVLLPLQWTLVIDQKTSLEEQLLSVGGRLLFSISEFFSRKPVEDPLFFIASMSITFWIISASAGFRLIRHQNFLAVALPSAIGILILQNYDNGAAGRLWFLAFFVFIALFLLGRLNFLQDQKHWRERRVFLSPENSVDLTSGMAIAAGLIILMAWTIPVSITRIDSARQAWNRITKPWNDFSKRMENAVSALDSTSGGRPTEFYGTELELGLGFPLSDTVMFQVQVPDLAFGQKPPRYYWRGRVYDYFAKDQWYTTGTTRQEYSPQNPAPAIEQNAGGTLSRFIFNAGESRFALLYAPQQLVWASRGGSYLAAPAGEKKDLFSWSASPTLLPGETYQVDSVLSNPNIEQLREAGTEYPAWVTETYLQLPEDFSPRIRELAEEITAEAETPYDKAGAITRYLRDNIEYAATVPPAPRNTNALEWILFEHKQGYCVYYATSEILMLRSLGIPARMAVGFAQGEGFTNRDNNIPEEEGITLGSYIVRKKNAHAWPEVYFPGIGWVEFEPTGNQNPLNRPVALQDTGNITPPNAGLLGEEFSPPPSDNNPEVINDPASSTNNPLLYLVYLIPILLGTAALTIYFSRRYAIPTRIPILLRAGFERSGAQIPPWVANWERWVSISPIEQAFESINFGLRILKEPAPVHATPVERADKLAGILPHLQNPIKVLLDEHQTSLYTSRTADVTEARRAALQIRMQVIVSIVRHFWTGTYIAKT